MPEILTAILLLILGAAILIGGGEVFVRGATSIARLFRISPLVIGLTVVAAATSAPELAVSLIGVFGNNPNPDIALGNVLGSNIANILLILGVCSVLKPLKVSSTMIKREIPMMIIFSVLLWVICFFSTGTSLDGASVHRFPLWSGILFIALLAAYNVIIVGEAQKDRNKVHADQIAADTESKSSSVPGFGGSCLALLFLVVGLAMLIFGSNMFVEQAKTIARFCGVSELVISLTILAVGTSLPELVVGAVSVLRGNVDIAVGNVVGSNIFNLLGILGITAAAAGGFVVSNQALLFDMPIMAAVSILGGYLCFTGKRLDRWEGLFLLAVYVGYIVFLIKR